MYKLFKRSFAILLCMAMLLSMTPQLVFAEETEDTAAETSAEIASGTCGQEVNWVLTSDGTLTISGTGNMTYDYHSVEAPWESYISDINKVVIEEGVTSVSGGAFEECDNLTSVTLPDSVTNIGGRSFYGCKNLTSIAIPQNVTYVGDYAFEGCKSLSGVYISDLSKWCSITFTNSSANPLNTGADLYIDGALCTEMNIPAGVTDIGNYAFMGCGSLKSAKIPEGVTSIGNFAFGYCTELESVVIPDSVTSMGFSVFYYCEGLTGITLPDDLTEIGSNTFLFCKSLESVHLPANLKKIGNSAFVACNSLADITIPDGVTEIGEKAFYGCDMLTVFDIPGSVESIGERAFGNNEYLTAVIVASDNEYYCSVDGVLFDKEMTTLMVHPAARVIESGKYEIPDGVTNIHPEAFSYCLALTNVMIPQGVTTIGTAAFDECENLTTVEIPEGVTIIDSFTFADCVSLTNVIIPEGVTTIDNDAFLNCVCLKEIIIPSTVTTIGQAAFEECDLISIEIPASVSLISYSAFYGNSNVERIHFVGDAPSILSSAFGDIEAVAYYPVDNETWTSDVMQDYGGTLTWVGIGDITGIVLTGTPATNYAVGDSLNLDGLEVAAVDEYGTQIPISTSEWTVSDVDMSTIGAKTVTVTYEDWTTTFQVYVHEGKAEQLLDASTYPESTHNYENSLDETQTISCNGAEYLTLTFSEDTYTESGWDHIYVYDGSDNQIAEYTGSEAAGVSVTVPGDTAKIRLTSDGSVNGYGYAFTSIYAYGVIHTGTTVAEGVAATCTEDGYTDGTVCEVCGEVFGRAVIRALGHDYVSVVTEPTPEANGYTTHTCSRCNDSYTDSYTMYGAIEFGTCGDNLTWYLTEEYVLHIEGEGEMTEYSGSYGVPWYDYHSQIVAAEIEEGVTTIGGYAFSNCSSLASVAIPDSVTSIGYSAFRHCDVLTSVEIPAGVTQIASNAFYYCGSLTGFWVDEDNQYYSSDAYGVLYNRDKTTLIQAPRAIAVHYSVPDTVTEIAYCGFYNCDSLPEIIMPESLETIGNDAFTACNSLEDVQFTGNVPAIEAYSFRHTSTTAYYPRNNTTWTGDVQLNYGGSITWVGIGEIAEIAVSELTATNYAVGDTLDLDELQVIGVDEYGTQVPISVSELTISDVDMSTIGAKTVTVTYGDLSTSFQVYVHESKVDQLLDASTYPESTHNYENSLDETQTISYSGAEYLILTFSADTYTESYYDQIYVYDGSDNLIAQYSGSEAAGVSVTVPGDTAKIRLTSDGSVSDYGYSFSSIYAYGVVHTGTAVAEGVAATCTETGYTEGTVCEVCGEAFNRTVIPALGHDYVAVVTEATPEANGYTTHTCSRCGDSYVDSYTMYGAIAFGTCGDNLTWYLSEEYVLHIKGEGEMPSYSDSSDVPWDDYRSQVVTAEIEAGVTTIGNYAFYDCYNMTSVEIPDGVTSIGYCAFRYCSSLTSVEIPDSVTSIGEYAFYNCSSLTSVDIPDGVTSIGYCAFRYCSSLTSVDIPDGVTSISDYTFSDCNNMTSVELPDSVTNIGYAAFADCYNLTGIEIPASVTYIDSNAFTGCDNLAGIWVAEDNQNYSNDASGVLFNKDQTRLIRAPGALSGNYSIPDTVTTLADEAFRECYKMTSVEIPDGVTSISDFAFSDCYNMTSVTIPDSVTYIGDYAFYNCNSLVDVEIPNGVTSIGVEAFNSCDSLVNVEIPGGVTSIGDSAFADCSSLTSITLPSGLITIGYAAFDNCRSLNNVTIPESVTEIGSRAFYNCESLTSITIPNGVTSINSETFNDCDNLSSVTLSENLISIGSSAFRYCISLTSVTIPESVTSIESNAFRYCSSLTGFVVDEDNSCYSNDEAGVLFNKDKTELIQAPAEMEGTYSIPEGVATINDYAFYECGYLGSIITIPDSVTSIGDYAFAYGTERCQICFTGDAPSLESYVFRNIIATAYYPANNSTWTEDVMQDYGGILVWTAYDSLDEVAEPELMVVADGVCGDNLVWALDSDRTLTISGTGDMYDYEFFEAPWNQYGYHSFIKKILIENGVTRIGNYAFFDCENVTDVSISSSVEVIGTYSFSHCYNLERIELPSTLKNVGKYAFYWGSGADVYVPDMETWCGIQFEDTFANPFADSGSGANLYVAGEVVTDIVIPDSVTEIGANQFAGMVNITSVQIPEGVTAVGDYAFYMLPNGYGSSSKLKEITFPASVASIGSHALGCNEYLEKVVILNPECTFGDNMLLMNGHPEGDDEWVYTDLVIYGYAGSTAETYANDMGYEFAVLDASEVVASGTCGENLTWALTSDGILTISGEGEMDNYGDTNAPWSDYASDITSVVIEEGVTSIGDYAFQGCGNLASVYFEGDAPTFGGSDGNAFYGVTATVYYPANNETWTADVMQNYGGTLTWVAYGDEEPITITSQPVDFVGLVGDMATFTVVAEGEELSYQWYYSKDNGETWLKASCTESTYAVEFVAYRLNYQYRCEITDANGNTVTSDPATLRAEEVELVITTQPVSYVGAVNDEVSFTVEATGNGLVYEWFYSTDGTTWAKSYSPGYQTNTLAPVLRSHRDGNMYKCIVTDVFDNIVESDVVSMSVKASDVVITTQPTDVENAVLGQLYTFTVEATGDNLTYRWEVSSDGGETWSESWNQGYNTATLSVRMNANRDGNQYRCVITSGQKIVLTSDVAILDLQDPSVEIISQSGNVYVTAGTTATFTVEAEGMDLTYLWYRSNDKGATWNQTYLSGYNTNTLSFAANTNRAAMYMCKVTDGSGTSVWSDPVKLQILSAELKILTQPVSVTCAAGETAVFTVEAQGDTLAYQWYASADSGETWTMSYLTGYNTNEFSFAVNAARAAKLYKCVITDVAGNTVETDTVFVEIAG